MSSGENQFLQIPETESERTPELDDFLMIVRSGGADDGCVDVYRMSTIIDTFAERLNRNIPDGSIVLDDLSPNLINDIIRMGRGETTTTTPTTPTPTTPTTPAPSTQLPAAPPGVVPPPEILPTPDPQTTLVQRIPQLSQRPRINPPTPVSTPVTYHPSEPTNLYLIEDNGTILANWGDPEDDGGAAITNFEVAIATVASGTTIANLTWIDKQVGYSHLFSGLTNGTEYNVYVRCRNVAGYSFSVEQKGQPNQAPSTDLELTIEDLTGYYTYQGTDFTLVTYQLRYTEDTLDIATGEVTVNGGSLIQVNRFLNLHQVTVRPDNYDEGVSITVSTTATRTNLNKMIAAAVTSPKTLFRLGVGISNLEPPRNVQTVEGDQSVVVNFEAPLTELVGIEQLTGYQISTDNINWVNIAKDVYTHTIGALTNGTEYTIYLRSKSAVAYSRNVELKVTPGVATDVTAVPRSALPDIPRNAEMKQDQFGNLYFDWEAPLRDNFTGFRVRINTATASPIPGESTITEGTWMELAKNVRRYTHVSSTRWDYIQFEIQSTNSRGHSESVKFAPAVTAWPDPIQNVVVTAGNGVVRVAFDDLPDTPLDDAFDPFGSGQLAYSSPQFVNVKIYKSDELLVNVDTGGANSPLYFQLENEVAHRVEVRSRTSSFESDTVSTSTVTPSASNAVASVGAVENLSLTAGTNQIAASWDALTDADYYELTLSPRPAAADVNDVMTRLNYIYQPFRVDTNSYTFSELYTGTEYTIGVRGVSNNGTFGQLLEHPPIAQAVYGDYATDTETPT